MRGYATLVIASSRVKAKKYIVENRPRLDDALIITPLSVDRIRGMHFTRIEVVEPMMMENDFLLTVMAGLDEATRWGVPRD